MVEPNLVRDAIQSDTVLVSVMHANNEIVLYSLLKRLGTYVKEIRFYFL